MEVICSCGIGQNTNLGDVLRNVFLFWQHFNESHHKKIWGTIAIKG